jgi:NAD(P)-dependent dehydrogenase (short-subunit alcohol dehydrogenase family)
LLAKKGVRVAHVSRRPSLSEDIGAPKSTPSMALAADVSDPQSISKAVAQAWEAFGGIDYVVNAAGVGTPAPLEDLTPDVWRREIDINLSGSFYVARETGLRMRERGQGSIVLVGSELSLIGMDKLAHYCASKSGLVGLTKALATELAPTVRVNCVCPGPVDTPMMEEEIQWFGGTEEVRNQAVERVPLKRIATPEEIAAFIVFTLVDAEFATGSILSIDGGTTAL